MTSRFPIVILALSNGMGVLKDENTKKARVSQTRLTEIVLVAFTANINNLEWTYLSYIRMNIFSANEEYMTNC